MPTGPGCCVLYLQLWAGVRLSCDQRLRRGQPTASWLLRTGDGGGDGGTHLTNNTIHHTDN